MFIPLVFLCVSFVNVVFCTFEEPFVIPDASIEVFRPRGLRISIPDYPGVRLFAVHAVVNRDLNGLEAGDLSKDILKKTNGRWVFEDNKIKLNNGDVLNYWLFVIRGNLGYRLDDQTYYVRSFSAAPSGFLSSDKENSRTTTQRPNEYPEYSPGSSCQCNHQQSVIPPITIIPPICVQSQSATPAPQVAPQSAPADLLIWRELLVNLSTENAEYRTHVQVLQEINNLLGNKLRKAGDENLNKLILTGKFSRTDSPFPFVLTVLKDKLGIVDSRVLKGAVRNNDGTITFEMSSYEDKVNVLILAKEKLKESRFTIKDIEAISFLNSDTNEPVIDMRVKEDEVEELS